MKFKVTVGVFGIIANQANEILLVHRNDRDLWNLPGGGLERGESPWAGVVREVKEETGLEVEVLRLLGIYSKPQKDEIVFSFECKVTGGKLTLNEEATDLKYFSLNEIPQNIPQKQMARIYDYFKAQDKLIMKIQEEESSS